MAYRILENDPVSTKETADRQQNLNDSSLHHVPPLCKILSKSVCKICNFWRYFVHKKWLHKQTDRYTHTHTHTRTRPHLHYISAKLHYANIVANMLYNMLGTPSTDETPTILQEHVGNNVRVVEFGTNQPRSGRLKMQDLQENAGPGKWRTKSQGWKMQDQISLPLVEYVLIEFNSLNNKLIPNCVCFNTNST